MHNVVYSLYKDFCNTSMNIRSNISDCARIAFVLSLITTMLLLAGQSQAEAPRIVVGSISAPPGSVLQIPLSLESATATPVSTLVVRLSWPASLLTIEEVIPGALLATSGKALDYEVKEGLFSFSVHGGQEALASGTLCRVLAHVRPDASGPSEAHLNDAGVSAADAEAQPIAISVEAGVVQIDDQARPHSADTDKDWHVSLPELLRIIQFYNVGAYHCDGTTPDGFAPGPGNTSCTPHNADYNPTDWKISLVELYLMIQFYNAPIGVYHVRAGTEDGFAPGPFGITYETP